MKTYRATLYDRAGEIEVRFRARCFYEATREMWDWIENYPRYQPRALVEVSEPAEQLPLATAAD